MKLLPIVLLAASGHAFGQCEVIPESVSYVTVTATTSYSSVIPSKEDQVLTGRYGAWAPGTSGKFVVTPGNGVPINKPHVGTSSHLLLRIATDTKNGKGQQILWPSGTIDTDGNISGLASVVYDPNGTAVTSGGRYRHNPGPYTPTEPLIMPDDWCDRWGNTASTGPITIRSHGSVTMSVGGRPYVSSVSISAETAATLARPLALTASPSRMDFGTVAYPGTTQRELTTSVIGPAGTRYALAYSYIADSGPEHRVTVQGQTLPWTVSNQIQAGQSQDTQKVVVGVFSANSGAASGRLLITATLV